MRKFDNDCFVWVVGLYVAIVLLALYFGGCPYVQALCE